VLEAAGDYRIKATQGTQADIIKLAMVDINDLLVREGKKHEAHLLLQVHDELVYEVKEELRDELAKKIQHIMESALSSHETYGVPIIAEVKSGANWGDMNPLMLL
jgi:DNA polymerase-1